VEEGGPGVLRLVVIRTHVVKIVPYNFCKADGGHVSDMPVIEALSDMEVASVENNGFHEGEEGQRLQWRNTGSDVQTVAWELVRCGLT